MKHLIFLILFPIVIGTTPLETANKEAAVNFSYEDAEGNKVNLSDFKGSYVYVDLWATWCGPCIAQMPYLKKTYESYKDKNIQFISISLDNPNHKDKWLKKIKGKEMGLQLFEGSAGASEFISSLNVQFIPRFVLIDPEGNYVNKNAPEPSNPALNKLLKSLNL